MKKRLSVLFLITMICVLLAGCGAGEKLDSTDDINYSGKLSIGDKIYSGSNYIYIYDGIVNESIVISMSQRRTIFLPIGTKEWIALPEEGVKIKVINANKEDGTINIELIDTSN